MIADKDKLMEKISEIKKSESTDKFSDYAAAIEASAMTDRQKGYMDRFREELGSSHSADDEDYSWELRHVISLL